MIDDSILLPHYMEGLNPPQREAVETLDGPVLVLAGAGTGKTRALTTRLAHLLLTRRAAPWQTLTVTFTNKAAREMRDRVAHLLGEPPEGWWLGTFHALAARMLRRHAELIGLRPDFTILDTDDQLRLLKQLMQAENVDSKKWPARMLMGVIQRWKDKALTPEKLKPADAGDVAGGRILTLYQQYQDRLKTLNACDFGDLLLHTITLFQNDAEVLGKYQAQFRYILVDEYQDTNVAQYLWLRLLAQSHHNICCVGDDDQSIYAWRGAEIGNILRFETDFPGAKTIRLEQNYRSTGHILKTASGVIANNRGRLGKTLWTAADGGETVRIRAVWDGEEEARFIGEEIEDMARKGAKLGEMAVLVRAGFQTREFEDRFITLGLPYRVIGGPRFYERQEIRDAVAYLRLVAQPNDDLAFERIVNLPRRGIGAATMQVLHGQARSRDQSLMQALASLIETDELSGRARNGLGRFARDIARWRSEREALPPSELAQVILDESGYTAMWQTDKSPEAPGRLENLKELITAIAEFETLGGFLEHVALVMENQEGAGSDQVSLMTVHGAKGLEFDIVFLPGWEEGLFPNQRALDETGIAGLEEERRLAYVGLTRARQRAIITHAANRRVHGTWASSIPSRFIDEMPVGSVTVEAESGLYGGVRTDTFNDFARRSYMFDPSKQQGPRGPVIQGTGMAVPARKRPDTPFSNGDRVFHQKFGYGTIDAIDNDKLDVTFDHSGAKKVMDSFVVPAERAP